MRKGVTQKNVRFWERISFQRLLWRAVLYFILLTGLIIIMIPIVWQISTALKSPGVVFEYPPKWIPDPVVWHNFIDSLTILPFATFYKNSFLVISFTILGYLISCSLVAFSFARLRFPGRDIFFLVTLATMMIPEQVTMIPRFLIFKHLGWIDTLKTLIVPRFFGYPFYIFLLRQFFMTIPHELDNAAKIDGCSTWGVFCRIIIPLSKPALGILAIFAFVRNWNSFLEPLIYLTSQENFTVPLGLVAFKGTYITKWNLLMAGSFIAMLPCLLIFFFAQRYFVQGIVISGLKG